MDECGLPGSAADNATDMANGRFRSYSPSISFSSSGNWNVLGQSAGVQASFGSDAAAVWQLAISSAIIGTPLTLTASPAESPFEVEMSETICGRLPGTAESDGSPTI